MYVKGFPEIFFPMRTYLILSGENKEDLNIMTANWVFPISTNPDYVALAIREKTFTFKNIKKYKRYTLAVPNKQFKEIVKYCGKVSRYSTNKSKFEVLRLPIFTKSISTKEINNKKFPYVPYLPTMFLDVEEIEKIGRRYLVISKVVGVENLRLDSVLLQKEWKNLDDYIELELGENNERIQKI